MLIKGFLTAKGEGIRSYSEKLLISHYPKVYDEVFSLSSEKAPQQASEKVISEKVLHFEGKNEDLIQLSQQIVQQLSSEGYKVQSGTKPMGIIIQAQKAGVLRDIITADRAFTILISGEPDDFTIHVGIGKWIQNLAVAAVEAVLTSGLFLVVDVPEVLWTREVEKGIIKEITGIVVTGDS